MSVHAIVPLTKYCFAGISGNIVRVSSIKVQVISSAAVLKNGIAGIIARPIHHCLVVSQVCDGKRG